MCRLNYHVNVESLAWQLSLQMGAEGAPRALRVTLIDVAHRILYLLNNGLDFSSDLGRASVLPGINSSWIFFPSDGATMDLTPPGPPRDGAGSPLQ